MALNETDRIALYWSEGVTGSLRAAIKEVRATTPKQRRNNRAEILAGGCMLYRVFEFAQCDDSPHGPLIIERGGFTS
jgi:hypothetical protein